MEELVESRWSTLDVNLLKLILNHVKANDQTGQDTLSFILTCKRFLSAYQRSNNTEFYIWYHQKELQKILAAHASTRGTVMFFEMCAFIASYPGFTPETKTSLMRAIQAMLNITTEDDILGHSRFVGDTSAIGNFRTQFLSLITEDTIQLFYQCFHFRTSVFNKSPYHVALTNPRSTEVWVPQGVLASLAENIEDFIESGVVAALKTGHEENGIIPLQNAKKVTRLFTTLLSLSETPMNPQERNKQVQHAISKVTDATKAQHFNATVDWLLDRYFDSAYVINPALILLPSASSMKIMPEPVQRLILLAALVSFLVGLYSKPIRDRYRRLPEGYIRNTLLGCCTRRDEEAANVQQDGAERKLKRE